MDLLQDGQENRAADAAERGTDEERVHPGTLQRGAAHDGDGGAAKNVTEEREKKAGAEMLQDFAEFQAEAAFKEDEDQGERAESGGSAAENVGIDPVEDGTDQDAGGHEDDDIWHAREADEAIGDEGQD